MATTRLRRVFRYPDGSSDDENDRDELDEEEQENVIKRLQLLNEQRNCEYSRIFSIIPLCLISVFALPIFSTVSSLLERVSSLASVLSLLATAYTMKFKPGEQLDPKRKKFMTKTGLPTSLHKYLLPVNVVTCTLLVLESMTISSAISASRSHALTYCIPAVMLSMVLIAHKVMASVDIKHLENLRYEYKGA